MPIWSRAVDWCPPSKSLIGLNTKPMFHHQACSNPCSDWLWIPGCGHSAEAACFCSDSIVERNILQCNARASMLPPSSVCTKRGSRTALWKCFSIVGLVSELPTELIPMHFTWSCLFWTYLCRTTVSSFSGAESNMCSSFMGPSDGPFAEPESLAPPDFYNPSFQPASISNWKQGCSYNKCCQYMSARANTSAAYIVCMPEVCTAHWSIGQYAVKRRRSTLKRGSHTSKNSFFMPLTDHLYTLIQVLKMP